MPDYSLVEEGVLVLVNRLYSGTGLLNLISGSHLQLNDPGQAIADLGASVPHVYLAHNIVVMIKVMLATIY